MKVLVDTSFLMLCAEKGRDFITLAEETLGEKLECYVLEDVLNEVRMLASRKGKKAVMAAAALKIAEKMRVLKSDIKGVRKTDEKLLAESSRNKFVLATVDNQLIKKAKERGLPILTVKEDQSILFIGTLL